MKNKLLKSIALGVIIALAIACQPKKEDSKTADAPAVDKEKIKSEIVAMETVMADMYNMRSAASEEYYDDNATSFSQNKPPLVGKFAIDKSIKDDLTSFAAGDVISFSVNEIFPSSDGNQVVEIGSYKVVDAKETVKFTGNYMSLFEKKDGKYVCIRDMGASDMPKKQ
ncbi:nuclear transport factor 2 family protein [Flavobacterium paronense]|uniref:YybH family protein n=1 Tax=Flavobacterium paronense TaxID=1392775 RepID=A0ABV5GA79_9FLAO|nr:nuclear transport factor 2 family protein [Flavobacterium paronense]MDN3677377.1 nuclear transport factor 2 family protein [Flavobacterium paronense]